MGVGLRLILETNRVDPRARMHCRKNAKLKVPRPTLFESAFGSTSMPHTVSKARDSSL